MNKKTLVIGATTNESRYAWLATERLLQNRVEVVCVGIKNGACAGVPIQHGTPDISDVHTVTLYVGPMNQDVYVPYVLHLNPKRIIFNPGTENDRFIQKAQEMGIEVVTGCTLVMLASNQF